MKRTAQPALIGLRVCPFCGLPTGPEDRNEENVSWHPKCMAKGIKEGRAYKGVKS